MSPRAAQTCGICERVVSKYKCPSCLLPYCSVDCFKKHKEIPCVNPCTTEEKPATKEVSVETTDVVEEKSEAKASGSDASATKEVQVAVEEEAMHVVEKTQLEATGVSATEEVPVAIPINVEEAKDVVEKTKLEATGASATKEVPVARPIIVEEAKHVVEKTELEAIASSSEIREALKDEALQKLIANIDSSSNPLKALDEAMGEEAFRKLKEKILSDLSKKK